MNYLGKKKNQQGFTLVEVIVVAIIVAALAGVAIPMYTSYVGTSRQNAAANAAGSIAAFMGACMNQNGSVSTTGITLSTPKDLDSANASLSCNATTPATEMQIPKGFNVLIDTTTGKHRVRTRHLASPTSDTASYNF